MSAEKINENNQLGLDEKEQQLLLELLAKSDPTQTIKGYVDNVLVVLSPEELRRRILEKVQFEQPLTNGMEGEIYKISIGDKRYIVAKKRFDAIHGQNETDIQKLAYQASLELGEHVKVPKIIDNFSSEGNDFLIMEFINGKTLYTLVWEAIVNQILIPDFERKGGERFTEYLDMFDRSSDGKVFFTDDTQSENQVKNFLFEMYRNGWYHKNPLIFERDINSATYKTNPAMRDLYNSNIGKVSLFGADEKERVVRNIGEFITHLNNQGLYHRDLGGNPRNIMFSENEDGEKTPWIIDFGRGINSTPGNSSVWEDSLTGGRYDKDTFITTYINQIPAHGEVASKRSEVGSEVLSDFLETRLSKISKHRITEHNVKKWFPRASLDTRNSQSVEKFFGELINGEALLDGKEIYIAKRVYDKESKKNPMRISEEHPAAEGYIGLVIFLTERNLEPKTLIPDLIYKLGKARKGTKAHCIGLEIEKIYNNL